MGLLAQCARRAPVLADALNRVARAASGARACSSSAAEPGRFLSDAHHDEFAYLYDPRYELFFVRDAAPGASLEPGVAEAEHTARLRQDLADFEAAQRGGEGAAGRLLAVQRRRESDMALTAYNEYVRDLQSSVSRESSEMSLAQSHLLEWWAPVRNSLDLLQVKG